MKWIQNVAIYNMLERLLAGWHLLIILSANGYILVVEHFNDWGGFSSQYYEGPQMISIFFSLLSLNQQAFLSSWVELVQSNLCLLYFDSLHEFHSLSLSLLVVFHWFSIKPAGLNFVFWHATPGVHSPNGNTWRKSDNSCCCLFIIVVPLMKFCYWSDQWSQSWSCCLWGVMVRKACWCIKVFEEMIGAMERAAAEKMRRVKNRWGRGTITGSTLAREKVKLWLV